MIQKSVHRLLMTGFVAFISSLSLGGPSDKGIEHYRWEYKECICDRADDGN